MPLMNTLTRWAAVCCMLCLAVAITAPARAADEAHAAVPALEFPPLDAEALAVEDMLREDAGLAPRFAVPNPVLIMPEYDGAWDTLPDGSQRWRMRITTPGALSLNFGFERYVMPDGGSLRIFAADGQEKLPPFTAADNELHAELWTPVILSDDVIIEAIVPADARRQLELELTSINIGYRFFGEKLGGDKSGYCNIDVVCPEGDGWRDEIKSVGVISTGGSTFCTGFLVNNTAQDRTPYFMTAYHCGISSSNASSLVVYWNFESPTCGQQGGGSLSQFQTGSYFRAGYSSSDFTLVELDDEPLPEFDVVLAGWDRSSADASMAVAIHHPSTDEKSISFEYDPTTTTSYLGTSVPGNGTHVRVADWDVGTTEPGSSGSPLFNQDHRVIGQLHGGYAACGNNDADWYGRVSVSWTGGGSSSSRLSDWLDPIGTGEVAIDGLPYNNRTGLKVTPATTYAAAGDPGGPCLPTTFEYTLENVGEDPFDYAVTVDQDWVTVQNGTGTLAGGATSTVTLALTPFARNYGQGTYTAMVGFTNLTTAEGDTDREIDLVIGGPRPVVSYMLDSDPGWSTAGLWSFGAPTGAGGNYGNEDPTAGHTGAYVYGYNLNGDYTNYMSETYLVTPPHDLTGYSGVTLRFWRWLNVERPAYDHASIEVRAGGGSWTQVWTNGAEITDNSWTQQEIDLSSIADGQSGVEIRWVMGPTDSSWTYSGWNIDDIELLALAPAGDLPGDVNCDNVVDVYDINVFVMTIVDPAGYAAAYPGCDIMLADLTGDGIVDVFDIEPFVDLVLGQ